MTPEENTIKRIKDWMDEEFRVCYEFLNSNKETIPYDIRPRMGSASVIKRIMDDYDRTNHDVKKTMPKFTPEQNTGGNNA